jgi:hypothetical protein
MPRIRHQTLNCHNTELNLTYANLICELCNELNKSHSKNYIFAT